MNNLLTANLVRLKKDRVFWIGIIGMLLLCLYMCLIYKFSLNTDEVIPADAACMVHTQFLGVFVAAFCSLFIGTEYSDGTIRNKMIAGHKRSSIYMTNLFTSIIAGAVVSLTYIVMEFVMGVLLLDPIQSNISNLLLYLVANLTLIIAYASVFTLFSMCNQNKTVVAVLSLLAVFALWFIAVYIYSGLREPKVYDSYIYKDAAGKIINVSAEPNPNYLQGTKRSIYEFLFDFLPTGQAMQIASMEAKHLTIFPVYSLIISAVSTVTGLICFGKKDIK